MQAELQQQVERAQVDHHPAEAGEAEPDEGAVAGQAQPADVVEELQHAVEAELADAAGAVAEVDRLLRHPRAAVQQAVQQRHLEGVAQHRDLLHLGGAQGRGAGVAA